MTKRLIDAGSLWTDIMMLPHNGDIISSEEVEQAIKDAPTVDAVEVVHGRFIIDSEKNVIRCSVCGYETPTLIPYICDGVNWVPFFERKYCGNCGAKMDGDK